MSTDVAVERDETSELELARRAFRAELLEAGLLVDTSVPGLYGRSGLFEDVVDGIDAVVRAAGPGAAAARFRFPPVFPRTSFERTDYIASFPNLTGAVNTFTGTNAEHAQLLAARAEGRSWDKWLEPTDTMLVSAACHPAYPMFTGALPDGGALLDVYGYCFRHEPAFDPARMQAFRMHEFVRIGTADQAANHRDSWIERGLEVLSDLWLDATPVVANDPFFGRVGRMLAANQREENLKTELTVRLYGDLDEGTAIVSCNCHQDHFGVTFDIVTADGGVAHSACVGFGMERIALAMLRTHGMDPVALAECGESPDVAVTSRLIDISPDAYEPHPIHSDERTWTETNCYLDLWVEILHSLGLDPVPAAACAFGARFDGAQWTFLKFKTEDLFALYGIDVGEMNVWRRVLDHVEDNLAAGMLSTVEVDAHWLPDTVGTGYHETHTKTTIVANRIDRDAGVLEYFHNSGYHRLTGDDFRGLFGLGDAGPAPFTPYVEQVRFDGDPGFRVDRFDSVLRHHLATRPDGNPVRALGERVVADVPWIRDAGIETFHLWTFGVLRQCGATAELAADVCEYLERNGFAGAGAYAPGFRAVAQGAKSVQFQMARAARGRTVDPSAQLDGMAEAWERSVDGVARAVGRA